MSASSRKATYKYHPKPQVCGLSAGLQNHGATEFSVKVMHGNRSKNKIICCRSSKWILFRNMVNSSGNFMLISNK